MAQKINLLSYNWKNSYKIWKQKRGESNERELLLYNHTNINRQNKLDRTPDKKQRILLQNHTIRQDKLDRNPILFQIEKLKTMPKYRQLIMPLYIAFLRTSGGEKFRNRAELLLPAIAYAFNKSENPILDVNSICKQIGRTTGWYEESGIETIRNFLRIKFREYLSKIHLQYKNTKNSKEICAIKIKEMAMALRQSGCYPTPLIDTFITNDQEWNMQMYRALMEEPAERKFFGNRPHIFFPMLLEKFRDQSLDRWALFNKIFELYIDPVRQLQTPLPQFIVFFVEERLGRFFNFACHRGYFDAAHSVWEYSEKSKKKLYFISPTALFKLCLYNWINEKRLDARIVAERIQIRLYWLSKEKVDLNEEYVQKNNALEQMQLNEWRDLKNRMNSMNNCFRELMDNPQINEQERQKYSEIFVGFMRDQFREGGHL